MYKKYMIKFGNNTYHYGGTSVGPKDGTTIDNGMQYSTLSSVRRVGNMINKEYGINSVRHNQYYKQCYNDLIKDMKIVEVTFTTTEVEV